MTNVFNPSHQKKACIPTLVTLFGMVTDVSPAHPLNAFQRITVTGAPPRDEGMAIAPEATPTTPLTVTPELHRHVLGQI